MIIRRIQAERFSAIYFRVFCVVCGFEQTGLSAGKNSVSLIIRASVLGKSNFLCGISFFQSQCPQRKNVVFLVRFVAEVFLAYRHSCFG